MVAASIHRWGLLLGLASLSPAASAVSPSGVEPVNVFISGENGYHTYRIPAVLRAPNGHLLAFCEGRKRNGGDTGDIDLVLKRSSDDGQSWMGMQVVWDDADNTCGNPCPVLDQSTGTLLLLATHNLGADRERDIAARKSTGTRTVWLITSKDSGATWSKPTEITAAVKDPAWTWYATGPGVGIQLQQGPHAGRLVIPCDHNYDPADTPGQHQTGSHVIFSDDHGATWHIGGVVRPRMNECQVAEIFDHHGTLLLSMRSTNPLHRRMQALSSDGGATWTKPFAAADLAEPVCQASLLRHESAHLLLFSNPASEHRANLTVQASTDNGEHWRSVVRLHEGPASYSCLVALGNLAAGCLYECGTQRPYERIAFARFDLAPLAAP